ncbi:MAG: hypothetical protein GY832_40125 [Chloroflexi bacterium]|nr:hypothetical protein [Chloroflexota bacterium]
MYVSGNATLNRTQIVNNSASEYGGGMYIDGGNATLSETQVISNSAFSGGGMLVRDGSVMLSETQVVSNSAGRNGGGVTVEGYNATLNVSGGLIYSNTASYGGGVYIWESRATLNGTHVVSNSASVGGGVYFASDKTVTLNRTQIVNNSASDDGGGVHVSRGSATLSGTQIVGNSAYYDGGGVNIVGGGSATLNETQVVNNSAQYGGGMYIYKGSATLSGTQVINNSARDGGGVYVRDGSATLNGTQIIANDARSGSGSGLRFYGNGTITATNGCIVFNSDTAVSCTSGTLIATDNWWGMADGPGGVGSGSGDTVSEGVDYANFKTVAPTGCPSRSPSYDSTPAPGSIINVGTTNVGSTISTTLTISETGTLLLMVAPTLSGPDATNFGFTPITLTIPDGGVAQDLTISCTPSFTGTLAGTLMGTLAATLTVVHNAPDSPAIYPLICTGEALRYIYLPLVLKNK